MRGVCKVNVMGNLGKDPEIRQGRNGNSWCTFSLATNRPRKEGDQWVEETDWHEVRAFGALAERCHRYLKRGGSAYVTGDLVLDKWQDDAGVRRITPRILASEVVFVSGPRSQGDEIDAPEVARAEIGSSDEVGLEA
jgi:single-strand DNA-binding protein